MAELNGEFKGWTEANIENVISRLERLERKIDSLKEQVDRQSGIFKIVNWTISGVIAAVIAAVVGVMVVKH